MKAEEEKQLLDTIENLMAFQERLEKGLKHATDAIIGLHNRIHMLEQAEKQRAVTPALLNVEGKRIN